MNIQHIAIIMDGNGRWATQRKRPRTFGHQAGVKSVKSTIETCVKLGVSNLTLFAFSSENWSRPAKEVNRLMDLFMRSLNKETPEMLRQGIKQNFIGDLTKFAPKLQAKMSEVSMQSPAELKMTLNVAVNYGGKWDITQAAQKVSHLVAAGQLNAIDVDESKFASHLMLADQPPVDLLIRTGGDHRISNFLLWQIAYAEVFFVEELWPDFSAQVFTQIIEAFHLRERRFGQTSEQINE